jgi:hypothetical protein
MDAMVDKKRLLKLLEMEPIAREATYVALMKYLPPSDEDKKHLTLGKAITDTEGVFELYIPADRPQDAKVISCAKVNRLTGDVKVEVFLAPM